MKALTLTMLLGLMVSACGVYTRAAVKNDGPEAITVTLAASSGGDKVVYEKIAPGTTAAFQRVKFDAYRAIDVQVTAGKGTAGKVDLHEKNDNTIVISPTEKPKAESAYNKDNEWW